MAKHPVYGRVIYYQFYRTCESAVLEPATCKQHTFFQALVLVISLPLNHVLWLADILPEDAADPINTLSEYKIAENK